MYREIDIQFVAKHDYDKQSAERFASYGGKSFSVNIFQWVLKSNGKSMKPSKGIVRVSGAPEIQVKVFEMAENIVKLLDAGDWDGRKTVVVN